MGDFFKKVTDAIDKATDALADAMTKNVKEGVVNVYRKKDLKDLLRIKQQEYPQVENCTISVKQGDEFDGKVFPEKKYIIRMLMLDKESKPITVKDHDDEYVGGLVIADSIDKDLMEFMGGKTEKTFHFQIKEK